MRDPATSDAIEAVGDITTQVAVIGSGAGGAITAATLAERGFEVALLEEGPDLDTSKLVTNSTQAMRTIYRSGGMTPILGRRNIGFVEGCCVGGSTEINSGFWHRLPLDSYYRWRADALLDEFSVELMTPYFERIERALSVSTSGSVAPPRSSEMLRRGARRLGWECVEAPRCQRGDPCANPFAPGAKQSMQRTYIPRALARGARLVANCRAVKIAHRRGRAHCVRTEIAGRAVEIRAEDFFVCCGPIQTPALLRRSGIRRNVGDNLCIHPMIKAAARFDEELGAADSALPIYQVEQFSPNISLGGSVFTPGFLAMTLGANWSALEAEMRHWESMALYYAASRGMRRGTVRALPGLRNGALVRYPLSEADRKNLSIGLARLCEVLFAAGARSVHPAVVSRPVLRSGDEVRSLLQRLLPLSAMDLTTVHAFSTCPMGENPDFCATDSFGKLGGFENLFVNDASLIPDSPGVNPQGTTMAIALRNAEHFAQERA